MDSPPQEATAFPEGHLPNMQEAARALANRDIPLVDNENLCSCLGLQLLEFAVPDALLSLSSQILSDHGSPRVSPSTVENYRHTASEDGCIVHKLDSACLIYLYPLSLVGFTLQDTVKAESTFDPTLKILTPQPRVYMSSLICYLLEHPLEDCTKRRVTDDLLSFITFYVLRYEPLDTKSGESAEDESEEAYQERIEEGLKMMKSWDWDADEKDYLPIAESVARDYRSIETLTSCG
ncbi:hypothetical protein POX_e06256 [Penicillium oxalicum]|uniref:hypothetical protein n=1 Tax=Penicillium oxalicum TaxID=69781 RepID=UPI0020B825BC|nr:hypothetical protein POX_e06256 [Penicillium oxalicum]KAI2788243.1 hypothetical protein POX_e06256 [Penicillium oxalicum]